MRISCVLCEAGACSKSFSVSLDKIGSFSCLSGISLGSICAEGGSISSFLGRGGSFSCVSEVSLGSICAEGGSISSFLGRGGSFSSVSEVSLGSICAEGGSISFFWGRGGSFSCVSEVSLGSICAEGGSISSFLERRVDFLRFYGFFGRYICRRRLDFFLFRQNRLVFWCFLFAWRPYLETDRFRGRSIGKIRRSSRIFIRYVFFFASSSLRR